MKLSELWTVMTEDVIHTIVCDDITEEMLFNGRHNEIPIKYSDYFVTSIKALAYNTMVINVRNPKDFGM